MIGYEVPIPEPKPQPVDPELLCTHCLVTAGDQTTVEVYPHGLVTSGLSRLINAVSLGVEATQADVTLCREIIHRHEQTLARLADRVNKLERCTVKIHPDTQPAQPPVADPQFVEPIRCGWVPARLFGDASDIVDISVPIRDDGYPPLHVKRYDRFYVRDGRLRWWGYNEMHPREPASTKAYEIPADGGPTDD
jgi:hypothetical protein